jgi:integrase
VQVYRAAETQSLTYSTIVRLLILTGQRRGEITGLKPVWFGHNEQAITLPEGFAKNSREHIIPLGPLALSLLAKVSTEGSHYFPSDGGKGGTFVRVRRRPQDRQLMS